MQSPDGWTHGYGPLIADTHRYWDREESKASGTSDLVRHHVAEGLHALFHQAGDELLRLTDDDLKIGQLTHRAERVRRMALGAMGLTMLLECDDFMQRAIVQDAQDGQAAGFANIVPDAHQDETTMPLDYRLHLPRELADDIFKPYDAENQWYRDGRLWVHRRESAEPSDGLLRDLARRQLQVDFDQMVTLYPTSPVCCHI